MKRLTAWALCLIMVLASVSAFAADEGKVTLVNKGGRFLQCRITTPNFRTSRSLSSGKSTQITLNQNVTVTFSQTVYLYPVTKSGSGYTIAPNAALYGSGTEFTFVKGNNLMLGVLAAPYGQPEPTPTPRCTPTLKPGETKKPDDDKKETPKPAISPNAVATGAAKVYGTANTSGEVVGSLAKGEGVQILEYTYGNGWYRVLYAGGQRAGWVEGKYITRK